MQENNIVLARDTAIKMFNDYIYILNKKEAKTLYKFLIRCDSEDRTKYVTAKNIKKIFGIAETVHHTIHKQLRTIEKSVDLKKLSSIIKRHK